MFYLLSNFQKQPKTPIQSRFLLNFPRI